jgi:hypothetical protein
MAGQFQTGSLFDGQAMLQAAGLTVCTVPELFPTYDQQ